VLMEGGKGLELLTARIETTVTRALQVPELAVHANALSAALQLVVTTTRAAWATGQPSDALANAVPYMQGFGHSVLAWIWLDVALAALQVDAGRSDAATAGKMGAVRYFYHYELPKISAWLQVVSARDMTCADLPEDAF
jgi:soluble lytic murein transglycosylase-like protein